jgi:hypothetical protein
MPDLHELDAQGKPASNGPARVFDLQTRQEIHLPLTREQLREAFPGIAGSDATENDMADEFKTTVIVIELRHLGELPDGLTNRLEQRAADYCANQTGRMVDVQVRAGYVLPIKGQ